MDVFELVFFTYIQSYITFYGINKNGPVFYMYAFFAIEIKIKYRLNFLRNKNKKCPQKEQPYLHTCTVVELSYLKDLV